MAMSNYWINMNSEGRRSTLRGGVGTGKTNGMELEIRVRDSGVSTVAFRVHGWANEYGSLSTRVYDSKGHEIGRLETVR